MLPVILMLALSVGLGWGIHDLGTSPWREETAKSLEVQEGLNIVHDTSYHFTRPLRYFDLKIPSVHLQSIQQSLRNLIIENRDRGNLFQASIYIRDMENGEWTAVNEDEGYHPGSLIKVPMLMYYLKASESNPNLLDKQLALPVNM